MLKGWGVTFIVIGIFWTLAGFLNYASDIQLGIAVGGLALVGIGILMVGIGGKLDSLVQAQAARDAQ
jgi:hypothetical protein